MNSKNAIKNVADVPNKFNKTGGEISGSIYPNTHRGLDIGKLNKSFKSLHYFVLYKK